jgi:class 3 adenylate cyclase
MAEPGTVTATFGFVDLAGFTALTEAHGDHSAVALLDRFETLVRDALTDNGELIKTIGDAVLLRFDAPGVAIAAMHSFFSAAVTEPEFPLARGGLHHGPAVSRGNDWFGATVNLTARVAAQASGGQLLATREVAQIAREHGHEVADLGTFRLRNIAEPIELFDIQLSPALNATAVDPVCRMQVRHTAAVGHLRHRDRDYWFCGLDCVRAFAADPDGYHNR